MKYRCPQCEHEQENPDQIPLCPQCTLEWSALESEEAPSFNPQRDDSNDSPFSLSVQITPQRKDATEITLELKLQNLTSEQVSGHVWLADKQGKAGSPESFSLGDNNSLTRSLGTFHPHIQFASSLPDHLTVRVTHPGSKEAFWQGGLKLQKEASGRLTVHIDESIQAETYLGGIDHADRPINISPEMSMRSQWRIVPLQLRGPLDLADHHDASLTEIAKQVFHRPMRIRSSESPPETIKTARLTLSHQGADGRLVYTQLFAGSVLNIGRARTWKMSRSQPTAPNDLILRTLQDDEADNYISRYHGRLEFTENGPTFVNLSSGGTQHDHRPLEKPDETSQIKGQASLKFGVSRTRQADESLQLKIKQTRCYVNTEVYDLLVSHNQLRHGLDPSCSNSALTLKRNDALEHLEQYIFFQQAIRIGTDSDCAWQMADASLQLRHATIVWLDGSFWIQPLSTECLIRFKSQTLLPNRMKRLLPDSEIQIGDAHFMVRPEYRQHILDCDCCLGHGPEHSCSCHDCLL